ncbi:MAG: cryptochrome/photolyase family protein [Pseudomonadota bacterium]
MSSLRIVLGDQLSHGLPIVAEAVDGDTFLLMEVADEASIVPHHPKKLVLVFSAMRHFAAELRDQGFSVDYIDLDSESSKDNFTATLIAYLDSHPVDDIIVTAPSEFRVREMVAQWEQTIGVPVTVLDDPRFVASIDEFADWAKGRKQLVMEQFYRVMRRKTGLLMAAGEPVGGQWNFDKDNRKPAKAGTDFPEPLQFAPDAITDAVIAMVKQRFGERFGETDPFWFAVTGRDAQRAANHFFDVALPLFGDYQDAMLDTEAFLFHSVLSHYVNLGLLDPLALCREAEQRYDDGRAPINAVEGFIRQLIGWREFVRGVYWLKMPDYASRNFFAADAPLPAAYWGAPTEMACIAGTVEQTRQHAYSHHIQRLMVTGNFAMLLGVAPEEIHRWYLAVYADAYEWVEMPNTIGMATFADGGVIGTKPYAASGAYINKMSNYCKGCHYDVKQRNGDDACPFNYLYWDFLDRHADRLADNRRMSLIYAQLRKMDPERRQNIRHDAQRFRQQLAAADEP